MRVYLTCLGINQVYFVKGIGMKKDSKGWEKLMIYWFGVGILDIRVTHSAMSMLLSFSTPASHGCCWKKREMEMVRGLRETTFTILLVYYYSFCSMVWNNLWKTNRSWQPFLFQNTKYRTRLKCSRCQINCVSCLLRKLWNLPSKIQDQVAL